MSVRKRWRPLETLDYVMLSERANDVYCAWQVTLLEKSVCLATNLKGVGGVKNGIGGDGGTGGGVTSEIKRLTVTGV